MALTDFTSWRWCLYINVPIAALNTVAVISSTGHLATGAASADDAIIHGYTTALTVSAGILVATAILIGVLLRSTRHGAGHHPLPGHRSEPTPGSRQRGNQK